MRHYNGNTKVKGGFYFNRASWEITVVSGKEGLLPGDDSADYVRVPTLVLFAGAPVLGGGFVLFLPLIGFVMLFGHVWRKLTAGVRHGGEELAAALGPRWTPGEATFTGTAKAAPKEPAKEPAPKPEPLEQLLKEVEERRRSS